jgi:hypothetical protein
MGPELFPFGPSKNAGVKSTRRLGLSRAKTIQGDIPHIFYMTAVGMTDRQA